jgi:hypothetical protein
MLLPSEDDLRAKTSQTPLDHSQRLQNLKASLRLAYKTVKQANRKSRQRNERLYNRKARLRNFHAGNLVYLYNPTVKPGLSRKFHQAWSGPYRITAKISDLNYEIVDQKNKKQIVHVNRLKQAYNSDTWKPKAKQKAKRKSRKKNSSTYRGGRRGRNQNWPLPTGTTDPTGRCNRTPNTA